MKLGLKRQYSRQGFTLVELLVAMAVTVVLLSILVYLTGVSMDTYKTSQNKIRATRQAKEALDIISKDLESLMVRYNDNNFEWLYCGDEPRGLEGPEGREVTNTSMLLFFTGATDRYSGEVNSGAGDVSLAAYRLVYRDQIGNTDDEKYAVFSMYRHLVDPVNAFDLLAKQDLKVAYENDFGDEASLTASNFLVENIYEFTVTFLVEYIDPQSGDKLIERVSMRQNGDNNYTEFRLKGDTIDSTGPNEKNVNTGKLIGAEISISVLTDQGVELAKRLPPPIWQEQSAKHIYNFTKTVVLPKSS